MTFDLGCSLGLLAFIVVTVTAYLVRAAYRGRARHERLAAEGSVLLGRLVMEGAYWVFGPLVGALAAVRVTPNMVTGASLVPALGAGVAVAAGFHGVGAVLATAAGLCDMLDGLLARRLGTASDAGEVFDATVDRYVEFFLLAGVVVVYRHSVPLLVVALGALCGAFMVSYATAKAETLGVSPPKGPMRRAERAVYMTFAVCLTPVWSRWVAGPGAPVVLRELPLVFATTLVCVVANASAIARLHRTAALVRERQAGSGGKTSPGAAATRPFPS